MADYGIARPPAPAWWVKRNRMAHPGAQALALTAMEPSILAGTGLFPAIQGLLLSGQAPVVRLGELLRPNGASSTLTGHAPRPGIGYRPGATTAALTGRAPQLATTLRPANGAPALIGADPVVRVGAILPPAVATLALTASTPLLRFGVGAFPTSQTASLSGSAPVLVTDLRPATSPLMIASHQPKVTVATNYYDDFTRANSNTLGNGWVEFNTSNISAEIASNNLIMSASSVSGGGSGSFKWLTSVANTDDQYVMATFSWSGSVAGWYIGLRGTAAAETTWAYFSVLPNGNWFISTAVNNDSTQRASGTAASSTVQGSRIRFEAIGNTYTGYRETGRETGVFEQIGQWVDTDGAFAVDSTRRVAGGRMALAQGNYVARMEDFSFGDIVT